MQELEIVGVVGEYGAPARSHTHVAWVKLAPKGEMTIETAAHLMRKHAAAFYVRTGDARVPLVLCTCDDRRGLFPHARLERDVGGELGALARPLHP